MKRYFYFIVFISLIFGCNSPQGPLKFEEKTLSMNESVSLEINYPWYTEGSERADSINATVGNVIANSVNMQDSLKNTSIEAAANTFVKTFERFKKDFNDTNQIWECFIDAEETYQSPEVLSIAINSYVDTGGAHGNTTITFLNFNPANGTLYTQEDLITDNEDLQKIVKKHFLKAVQKKSVESDLKDYFFGEEFHLPQNIGYSDEGLIFLYNTYEASAYALGITEFEMPFTEVSEYLKIQ